MEIKLSDHFDFKKLLRFTLPSVVMMLFTSIYGVVDGFFISNFVGKTPFAAVNFIMPFLMMVGAVGFMFGTGGSAWVAKTLGEGDSERANRNFSLFVYVSAGIGVIVAIVSIIFIRPLAQALGAQGAMLEDCVLYGIINLVVLPAYILQLEFQSYFIAAEKPKLGLLVTVSAGVANMILDALLVAVFPLGIVGAGVATAMSQVVGGVVPLFYFARENDSLLRLVKTNIDIPALIKTCTNGSSELLNNISMSLVGMLYNIQLLKYAGENGVAAYGTIMYVSFGFAAAFIGYSIGVAPVISYNYGAANHKELRGLLRKSGVVIAVFAVSMLSLAWFMAMPLSKLFVGYDAELLAMTCNGFKVYSFAFLFMGFAIFGSGFFTALNDGVTSAIISFLRTMVFQTSAVMLLPLIWGINGIWISVIVAEAMAVLVSLIFLKKKQKVFRY